MPQVLGDLFKFLNHHPGLVYLSLHTLCNEFTRVPVNANNVASIQELVANGQLIEQLFKWARCFLVRYEWIRRLLGEKTDPTFQKLIANGSLPVNDDDDVLNLHRYGICIVDRTESTMSFASSIMEQFYTSQYYKGIYGDNSPHVIRRWGKETVSSFLRKILALFNPQVLRNSKSVGEDGKRYERIYEDEFYRCCCMVGPFERLSDVGAIYGSKGYLDFYLYGEIYIQWGFELLRHGNRLKEHLKRFDPEEGIYRSIPLKDYAVVDFYESDTASNNPSEARKKQRTNMEEKYYRVVFSGDFESLKLHHNGSIESIELYGDAI